MTGKNIPNEIPLFNSPIGYTKNPLVYHEKLEQESNNSMANFPNFENLSIGNSSPTINKNHTIDKLPFEIRVKIANELNQLDCINLLLTNKSMYNSTIERIYQHIIIDENYSQFNYREYDYKFIRKSNELNCYTECSCTYINSVYNFKKFLKSYTDLIDKGKQIDIKILKIIKLPDSVNTYDYEIHNNINNFFSKLKNLQELIWKHENFKLDWLYTLKNSCGDKIIKLDLNVRFSNYLSELIPDQYEYQMDSSYSYSSEESVSEAFSNGSGPYNHFNLNVHQNFEFPNLTQFSLKPFYNSTKLSKIIDSILIGHKSNIKRVSNNLTCFEISKFVKRSSSCIRPMAMNLNYEELLDEYGYDLNVIPGVLENSQLRYLKNLTRLSINDCLVNPDEGIEMVQSINLKHLKVLILENIIQYNGENNLEDENIQNQPSSFISKLSPHLKNLQYLRLDFGEIYYDTVPRFLDDLIKLKGLDLIIRLNSSKFTDSFTKNDLYQQYSQAIISNNKWQSLNKLSIELKWEDDLSGSHLDLSIPDDFFYPELSKCINLTSIRMNPMISISSTTNSSNNNLSNSNNLVKLISGLPKLNKLHVFGTKAGGAPNLALGNLTPTVHDAWFRVQHVAMIYLSNCQTLDYIKVNKWVFDCFAPNESKVKDRVNPRDGIERWFDERVRVE